LILKCNDHFFLAAGDGCAGKKKRQTTYEQRFDIELHVEISWDYKICDETHTVRVSHSLNLGTVQIVAEHLKR
jgi:hypothetical protein